MSKLFRAFRSALPLVAFSLASPATILGYEVDVHFGLTFWLARQAGLRQDCAREIAQATQYVDVSHYTAPVTSTLFAAVFEDFGASRAVRETHYPADGAVPGQASFRQVERDSPRARWLVESELRHKGRNWLVDARRLGRALHTYQDSWSHAGTPDTPTVGELVDWAASNQHSSFLPRLPQGITDRILDGLGHYSDTTPRAEFLWGHPESRSRCGRLSGQRAGWQSHFADQTHCHGSEEIEQLSKQVFEWLQRFRRKHGWCDDPDIGSASWVATRPKVEEFAQCRTVHQKKAWFEANCTEGTCQDMQLRSSRAAGKPGCLREPEYSWLNGTSLECGESSPKSCVVGTGEEGAGRATTRRARTPEFRHASRSSAVVASFPRPRASPRSSEVDGDCVACEESCHERHPSLAAEEFLRRFLERWLKSAESPEERNQLVRDFVDTQALAGFYSRFEMAESDSSRWSESFLDMWLCQNHGRVNELGHGSPALSEDAWNVAWRQECGEEASEKWQGRQGDSRFGDVSFAYDVLHVGMNEEDRRVFLGLVRVSSAPGDLIVLAYVMRPKPKLLLMDWLVH